ncbi:MAG: aspartate aminotransferase family protein [Candidatus Bathyarchaeia archaeon]|jgi:acetylornithine/LysW-gamma-L-lysine aminotransferase
MNETEILELEQKHLANVYAKKDLIIVKGQGANLWDINNKKYIDCTGSYGVSILGHCHPKIVEAIKRQSEILISCHGSLYNDSRSEFLKKIIKILPKGLEKAFLSNSGAEAVECAIKLARKFSGKKEIIAMMNSYHGKTMGALSATWDRKYREPFLPLVPEFKHVPYGKITKLEEALSENTAAVIVEPIQGEGGVKIPPKGYMKDVRQICDEKGTIMVADEVQTGFGRTGKVFACEHSDITPDIMCLAKSVAGGLPLGITVARPEIMSSFRLGEHSTTFGGNPLVCAAASAAIDVLIEERLPERASKLGGHFMTRLSELQNKHKIIREVRGMGMMIGVEFRFDVLNILRGLIRKSILALDAGRNIVRFLPPLVISEEQLDMVIESFDQVISEEENANPRG